MAVIVNGDGILTGVSSLTTALDDITSGRGTITGVTTVGTLQLGTGVSISSPRSQNAAIFTNNSEFLTVDDAGRVGVGTVTPNSDAHPQNVGKINVGFITARSVAGDIDGNTLVVAGISTFVGALNASSVVSSGAVSGTTGTFTGNVTVTGTQPTILLTDTDNNPDYLIKNGNGELNFQDATASANRLSIDSSGNVVVTLDLIIADKIVHNGDNSAIRFPANDMISFETGGTEVARFNNSQLFLIGTNSALHSRGSKVQIGHTDANARLDIARYSNDSAPPYLEFLKSRGGTVGSSGLVQDGDELGTIRWNGDNGSGSMFAAQIQVFAGATPGSGSDMPAEMSFSTTADGSGTPSEKLRIASDGQLKHTYDIGSNGDAGLILDTDDGTKASSVLFRANTENRARIDVQRLAGDGGQLKIQVAQMDNSNTLLDAMTIAPVSSGDTTPDITLTGNLKLASGNGIDFSATSGTGTSELLDDYEEGSWTPSFSYSDGGTPTLSEAYGYYVKVGRMVHCLFTTTNSAQGGGSGNVLLNNLPFTSSGNNGFRHNGNVTYFTGMGSGIRSNMVVYNAGATTSVYFYHQNSANTQIESITRNYFSDNTTLRGHIIFYV